MKEALTNTEPVNVFTYLNSNSTNTNAKTRGKFCAVYLPKYSTPTFELARTFTQTQKAGFINAKIKLFMSLFYTCCWFNLINFLHSGNHKGQKMVFNNS